MRKKAKKLRKKAKKMRKNAQEYARKFRDTYPLKLAPRHCLCNGFVILRLNEFDWRDWNHLELLNVKIF